MMTPMDAMTASEEGSASQEIWCSVRSCSGTASNAAASRIHCHLGSCTVAMFCSESAHASRKYGSSDAQLRSTAQRVRRPKSEPPKASARSWSVRKGCDA